MAAAPIVEIRSRTLTEKSRRGSVDARRVPFPLLVLLTILLAAGPDPFTSEPGIITKPAPVKEGAARPKGKPGTLLITSHPPWATVTLDGEELGRTPIRVTRVFPGQHKILFAMSGFRSHEEQVKVEEGREAHAWARLDPLRARLHVDSTPRNALVVVDGRQVGNTPFSGQVWGGAHVVELLLPGHIPHKEEVSILGGNEGRIEVMLRQGIDIIVPDISSTLVREQDRHFEWPAASEHVGPRGSPMVLVEAGPFLRGSPDDDKLAYPAEKPQRTVSLEAFLIDRFEVPNALYRRFLNEVEGRDHEHCHRTERPGKDHTPIQETFLAPEWNDARQPVSGVDWWDAYAFCAWAGKRLPSEAEWEKAARGTDGRVYPWGDDDPASRPYGNFAELAYRFRNPDWTWIVGEYDDGFPWPAPIGRFPRGASPYGAEDMAGNVVEWVMDWYAEDYYREGPDKDPRGPGRGERRVARGGGWNDTSWELRSANRLPLTPSVRIRNVGFRCAMDAP